MKTDFNPGPGLHDLPAEFYHALKHYVSNSMLSEFRVSPAHLQAILRNPKEQTPAQALGSLIHTSVLEPEFLDREYVAVTEKFKMNTNAGKAAAEKFAIDFPGKKALDAATYDQVVGILRSVYSHDSASAFLRDGVAERSVFWKDEKSGVLCRARPDYYREKDATLIDFKSTLDARPREFQRSATEYGYFRQIVLYARGLRANGFPVERMIIIAGEKTDPYGVRVYEVDPSAVIRAEAEIDETLEQYAECLKKDEWPGYTSDIESLGYAPWA